MSTQLWGLVGYGRSVRLFVAVLLWLVSPVLSQTALITHFIAPQYPPLARRTTVSGQVVLKAAVGPAGKIIKVAVDASAHPFLTESATAAVKQWEFSPGHTERIVTIMVIYGFSGKTRETDAITTVGADFDQLGVRVFVTTDAFPLGHESEEKRGRD